MARLVTKFKYLKPDQEKPIGGYATYIATRAIEDNAHEILNQKTYADYIGTRPGAERFGSHGLFTDDGVQVKLKEVSQLVKMTGASRGFFYKNPIVRAEIDRAMEQQAGTINPRRGILDKAMEGRIDLLQEEIFRLRQENQALRDENQRLQKIISKKSRSEFRSL